MEWIFFILFWLHPPSPQDYQVFEQPVVKEQKKVKVMTEVECLTEALYYEARGQSVDGQTAVAEVVLNRMSRSNMTACQVVHERTYGYYQFSYMYDRYPIKDKQALLTARHIALQTLKDRRTSTDATSYKRCDLESSYFNQLEYLFQIDDHCFYRDNKKPQIAQAI